MEEFHKVSAMFRGIQVWDNQEMKSQTWPPALEVVIGFPKKDLSLSERPIKTIPKRSSFKLPCRVFNKNLFSGGGSSQHNKDSSSQGVTSSTSSSSNPMSNSGGSGSSKGPPGSSSSSSGRQLHPQQEGGGTGGGPAGNPTQMDFSITGMTQG